MKTVAVVYASTTGNTEAMANAIVEGAGSSATLYKADEADAAAVLAADVIALGSPAMGSEELEDSMENFFSGIESSLSGKTVALFGSYDWGDGQWIASWEDRVKAAGATLYGESVKAHTTPEDADLEACKSLGKGLAS
ncbi:MAG: flavodoxin [Treponema sp.]|nr:flavodoxin [Treponema sp.]